MTDPCRTPQIEPPAQGRFRRRIKLGLTVTFTIFILIALYSLIDVQDMREMLLSGDPFWLAAYLGLFLPQLGLAGLRWQAIAREFGGVRLGYGRSVVQTLGGYSANLVVPGKLGEMVKGLWLFVEGRKFLPYFLVLLEKLFDLAATLALLTVALCFVLPTPLFQPWYVLAGLLGMLLLGWLVAGIVLRGQIPVKLLCRVAFKDDPECVRGAWKEMLSNRAGLVRVSVLSLLLWSVQVFQFWCMFRVFGAVLPLDELYVGAPLALLAGIAPLTTGGVGTRDAALLWYFGSGASGLLDMELVLAVGVLSVVRVILPGLLGLPCFHLEMRRRDNGK